MNLWKWDGKVSRATYALVGFIGVAIKQNLDRAIGVYKFNLPNIFFNYWAPLNKAARLNHLTPSESKYLLTILLLALPFLWVGVAMTVRRLRDAGLPIWLVTLFFLPFVNLAFFLLLCFLPPKEREISEEAAPWPDVRPLSRLIPRGQWTSALVAIAVTTAIGLVFSLFAAMVIGSYGWSLFVALPFCLGLFSTLLYSYHQERTFFACMQVALLPIVILGLSLIAVAVEGLICVLMAAPVALIPAAIGGALGYRIQVRHWRSRNAPAFLSAVLLMMPLSFGVEHGAALQPPTFMVRSSIEVNAPPEKVWQEVIAFAQIPPPTELLFQSGVAYPIRAEIVGRGPGAIRRCIFSTGAFVEPIEIWDEPRLLKFGVTETPSPLNELTPYGHIEPRHLHGYFVSKQGQFVLTALPDGRTRLEGTTWYRNTIWPAGYWRLWSDYIVHRIHMRVLTHIRTQVESASRGDLRSR
ncbi:MAG TPA: DUF805 domain-containing protein [Candidatus Acidoferrum sp.]